MKYVKSFFIFLIVVSFSSQAFALFGSKNRARKRAKRMVNASLEENASSIDQSKSAEAQQTPTSSDFSGNAAASDSDLTGKLSMVAGVAAIGFGISKIPSCVKPNFGACAQVALALAQAGSMFGQGGSAFDTRGDLCGDCDWGTNGGVNLSNLDDGDTGLNENLTKAFESGNANDYLSTATLAQAQIDQGFATLEAQGLTVDKESGAVFDSNGNKISAGANGGVPAALSAKLTKTIDAVKNAHKGGQSGQSSASSGGSGSGSSIVYDDDFGTASRGIASKKDSKKKDDFLAGLSDGSKGGIGVAGDDIFKMMTRRYSKKIKSREFILKK